MHWADIPEWGCGCSFCLAGRSQSGTGLRLLASSSWCLPRTATGRRGFSWHGYRCRADGRPAGKCPRRGGWKLRQATLEMRIPPNGAASAPAPAASITRYHFRIDERFAGPDSGGNRCVSPAGDDGDCGYRFKQGEQYVVFTQQEVDGKLFATICNGTRPASEGIALIPQLRAMRNGQRVASVFGVLRRSDPPFLAPPDDPDDPLPRIALRLRSRDDRFSTSTGPNGVYTFYDVHAGEYQLHGEPSRAHGTDAENTYRRPAPIQNPEWRVLRIQRRCASHRTYSRQCAWALTASRYGLPLWSFIGQGSTEISGRALGISRIQRLF